jgi:hypothetical protein
MFRPLRAALDLPDDDGIIPGHKAIAPSARVIFSGSLALPG